MASRTQVPGPSGDRTVLRARLSDLQAKLRAAVADKRSRMNDIVALCRSERRAMRDELRDKRKHALEQIEYEIAAARASARHLRLSRLAEVRKAADSDIAAARAAIHVERAHQDELRRISHEQRRRRSEVNRLHEIAARSGELHTSLLGPFAELVQRVGSKVKPVRGESRAEGVLRYAQTHPHEAHAAAEPRAEQVIEETRREIARTKAALRSAPRGPRRSRQSPPSKYPSASRGQGASGKPPVPVKEPERAAHGKGMSRRSGAPIGTPMAARRPGQVPRGGGPGVPVEVLLRERDLLAGKGVPAGSRMSTMAQANGEAATTGRASRARGTRGKRSSRPPSSSPPSRAPAPVAPPHAAHGLPPALAPANETARARTETTVKAPELHDTAALAKLIRQDIQAARSAGDLPAAKYSVTTEKYSMGSTINVVASKLPFPVLNDAAFYPTKFGPQFDSGRFRTRFTPEAESLQRKLEEIVGAYHWDRSDPMTDYYHQRFHKDVRLDDRGEMDRIRERFAKGAKDPSKASEPFVWNEPAGGLLAEGWYASDDSRGRRGPFASKTDAERS